MACASNGRGPLGKSGNATRHRRPAMLHPLETLADVLIDILLWLMPIEEE